MAFWTAVALATVAADRDREYGRQSAWPQVRRQRTALPSMLTSAGNRLGYRAQVKLCTQNRSRILPAARKMHSQDYAPMAEPTPLERQRRDSEIFEYLSRRLQQPTSSVNGRLMLMRKCHRWKDRARPRVNRRVPDQSKYRKLSSAVRRFLGWPLPRRCGSDN